jgi:hypothetical protein
MPREHFSHVRSWRSFPLASELRRLFRVAAQFRNSSRKPCLELLPAHLENSRYRLGHGRDGEAQDEVDEREADDRIECRTIDQVRREATLTRRGNVFNRANPAGAAMPYVPSFLTQPAIQPWFSTEIAFSHSTTNAPGSAAAAPLAQRLRRSSSLRRVVS